MFFESMRNTLTLSERESEGEEEREFGQREILRERECQAVKPDSFWHILNLKMGNKKCRVKRACYVLWQEMVTSVSSATRGQLRALG